MKPNYFRNLMDNIFSFLENMTKLEMAILLSICSLTLLYPLFMQYQNYQKDQAFIAMIEDMHKVKCTEAVFPIYGKDLTILNEKSGGDYLQCGDRVYYL